MWKTAFKKFNEFILEYSDPYLTFEFSIQTIFNPFQDNVPLLYTLKNLENQRFSDVFRGYKKETLTWNGLIARIASKNFLWICNALQNKCNSRNNLSSDEIVTHYLSVSRHRPQCMLAAGVSGRVEQWDSASPSESKVRKFKFHWSTRLGCGSNLVARFPVPF